jgi:hypothetical protein
MIRASLHSRLRARSSGTAARVRVALAARFRSDRFVPEPDLAHLRDVVDQAVLVGLDLMRSRGELPLEFVEACQEVAAAAARRQRPPDEVATYAALVAATVQAEYWAQAEPGDHLELVAYTLHVSTLVPHLQARMQLAYFDQLRRDGFDPDSGRHVARALVEGRATAEMLWAAGHPPARRYQVVVVRADPDADVEMAVGDALAQVPDALQCMVGSDVVLLEPADPGSDPPVPPRMGLLLQDDPRLAAAAIVTEPADGLGAVPASVASAQRYAALAVRTGRVGRLSTHNDLFLESRLLADSRAVRELRGLVAPLAAEPELMRTLQALYLNDLDRTRTAHQLGIARRTLAYRTDRVRELVGLDPTGTRGVQVLGVALAALRGRGLLT